MNIKTSILQRKQSKPTYLVLLVSLSVHIGFILLIALATKESNLESVVTVNKELPLKSYIFIPKPLPDVSKPPEIQQSNSDLKISAIEQNVVLEKIKMIKSAEPVNQADSIAHSTLIEQTPISDLQAKNEPKEVRIVVSNSKNSETTIMSDIDAKYKTLISKHLANYHSNYSEQQAQEYRTLKKSPIIDTTNSTNTNEMVLEAPIVSVNCNNTGTQVVALISGLMNGTVKCERNNSFQGYIDQRLNPNAIKAINPPKITDKVTLKSVNYAGEENSDDVN